MVHWDEMMGVLLDACPSFSEAWQAFLDDWREPTTIARLGHQVSTGARLVGE